MTGKNKGTTLDDLALAIYAMDKKFDSTLEELRHDRKVNQDKYKQINKRLNQVESFVYKKSLIISGIKETADEDLSYLVGKIAQALGQPIGNTEIDDIWRFGKEKERIKVIFLRTIVKRALLKKIREVKKLSTKQIGLSYEQEIYLSEEVAVGDVSIWYHARKLKKDGKLAQTWVQNGKVLYKVQEGDKPKLCGSVREILEAAGETDIVISSSDSEDDGQQKNNKKRASTDSEDEKKRKKTKKHK